ncbi:hypothetical protein HH310_34020 [Actinoplanes sp. TBRC 11911]|uniref:pilus assembly protein TadG-related protein n=1 Tax=Actinoplanes sp. TBRC 11911 TaxID=2729386 RepID=UPI00145F3B13|nr:hypothetical protein [Actinoplanes sp. TBRC 11911]
MLAVLLSGGVLFGMGAIVIDYGRLLVEREELQSGADAASWKIAVNCALTPASCTSALQTPVAVTYAQKNAKDQAAAAQICLNNSGCPSPWKTAVTCPAMPAAAAGYSVGKYVEVRTSTLTTSGSTLLPPSFAQAMPGSTYTGKQVGACGRVNWGPAAAENVFALGISKCDYDRMTSSGSTFYGPLGSLLDQTGLFSVLGLPSASSGVDSAVVLGTPISVLGLPVTSCTTPTLNLSIPRGYVWLTYPDLTGPDPATCTLNLKVGDNPRSNLLSPLVNTVANTCAAKLAAYRGSTLTVPIYDSVGGSLASLIPSYHIAGFASFVVTGYTGLLGGLLGAVGSLVTGASLFSVLNTALCSALSSCIYGYFTRTLTPQQNPQFGTGNDYGATIIGRTG